MYMARIAAYDAAGPKLNSISVTSKQAADEAAALDAERKAGKVRGPLHGIPVIVKDNFETSNMQTAAGSKAMAGYIPQRDAFLVTKLEKAGAIIIGKGNMDELGLGISGQGSLFGQVRNPYAPDSSARAARAPDRRSRWRQTWPPQRWAATPAARSACRPPTTRSSACAAPRDC